MREFLFVGLYTKNASFGEGMSAMIDSRGLFDVLLFFSQSLSLMKNYKLIFCRLDFSCVFFEGGEAITMLQKPQTKCCTVIACTNTAYRTRSYCSQFMIFSVKS